MTHVDWLDRLVYKKIEALRQVCLKRQSQARNNGEDQMLPLPQDQVSATQVNPSWRDQERGVLLVELQKFDHPIVFADTHYPGPLPLKVPVNLIRPPPLLSAESLYSSPLNEGVGQSQQLWRIYDPEQFQKINLCEDMHKRLARGRRTGLLDRDLKPSAKIRDELHRIIAYPPTKELDQAEKDLLWKFRHHLAKDKRALTKFVKSVDWADPSEVVPATQLLDKWVDVKIDDALELLGPTVTNRQVRAYAVDRLSKADDEVSLI